MNRIISLVLLSLVALPLFSQNLVLNTGFESWQKINKPAGWTTALGCLKDSLQVYTGIYSCRHEAASESRELGQVITVTEGTSYRLSIWYKTETLTGNGCRIWSNWKDADGNSVADEISQPFLHSGYLKSETWKEYTAVVTAPVSATLFNLVIRTLPNSVTFWDDIVFGENVPTIKSENEYKKISVYPNPAVNYLTINNIQDMQHIEIQSITGIKLLYLKISGEEYTTIPLSGFKNGIYNISIYSSTRRYSCRFIKIDL